MSEIQKLVGKYDITEILEEESTLDTTFYIKFEWEDDVGCFNVKKSSYLTIFCRSWNKEDLIKDIFNKKSPVYEYIKLHKEYAGQSIDLR